MSFARRLHQRHNHLEKKVSLLFNLCSFLWLLVLLSVGASPLGSIDWESDDSLAVLSILAAATMSQFASC